MFYSTLKFRQMLGKSMFSECSKVKIHIGYMNVFLSALKFRYTLGIWMFYSTLMFRYILGI